MVRLTLVLEDRAQWLRVFDPRGGSLFVAGDTSPAPGTSVRVDLHITDGGPRLIMSGTVLWVRGPGDPAGPAGCSITIGRENREKINFVNGFVRGGLINRRERRRLPLRLPVAYGGYEGTVHTHSRDINEEGIFVLTEEPLAEETRVHLVITVPGVAEPLTLEGIVTHTVVVADEDVPGMGIRFLFAVDADLDQVEWQRDKLERIVDNLEQGFLSGKLPDDIIA